MLKNKRRFVTDVLLIFFIVAFTSCSEQYIDNADKTALHESLIDSLIVASSQNYYLNKDSVPVFDKTLKKAFSLAEQDKNELKIGEILVVLGKRQRDASEFAKAINYFQQAIVISGTELNDELHAKAAHELAVVFRRMDDNAQAHRLYIESLEWAESANDTFLIHCSYNGIGNVFFNYKDYEKAIIYYHKSLNFLGKKNRNLLGEAINTNTLGEAWLFLGNADSAMFYLNRSFNINVKIDSKVGQAICYNGIGMVYHWQGKYDKAIEEYKKALEIDKKELGIEYHSMILTSLGKSFLAKEQYNKAERVLVESYEISSAIGLRDRALDALTELVNLYELTQQLHKALVYNKTSMAYKDSMNRELISHNSMAMNTLYKTEQQEREIVILKQNAELDALKLNRQRIMITSIFISGFVLLAFALIFYRQRRLQNIIENVELEQQLFRAQLNPHFVFNSLSALQSFFMSNDKMAASDYLANFSRLMRNILMGSRTEALSLEKEIELLTDYLRLQQLRFNNVFNFNIECDHTIDAEIVQIPPMLVQPFVENSIEHGMRNIDYMGEILISFARNNKYLDIIISDNGTGLKHTGVNTKDHTSLAMKITRERIANIERISKQKCKFEIINKADLNRGSGVSVSLSIPYNED